jgi:salicylate hydroxylase
MGPSGFHPQICASASLLAIRPTNFSKAHRKELLDIMTSFIPADRVKFNKLLTGIQQDPDKVVLTFADGTAAEADTLVGADGIQSMVRGHVLKRYAEQAAPVYANAYCYRGVIPMVEAHEILGDLTDVAKFYFGYKRSAVTYRISGGKVCDIR